MKSWLLVVAGTLVLTLGGGEATASAPTAGGEVSGQSSHGVHYGEGLRHFAEGRFEAAVGALFRAYGLEPSAHVMALIVDAYDEMGHCSAAERQLAFFEDRYDEQEEPQLERCRETGELVVRCETVGDIVIDGVIEARCGDAVLLPGGQQHRIVDRATGFSRRVELEVDQRREIDIDSDVQAEVVRIPDTIGDVPLLPFEPAVTAEVRKLPFEFEEGPDVPRLTLPDEFDEESYRVVRTPDGLYRIGAPEGEALPEPVEGANVEIICPTGAPGEDEAADCIWLRERSDESGDEQ